MEGGTFKSVMTVADLRPKRAEDTATIQALRGWGGMLMLQVPSAGSASRLDLVGRDQILLLLRLSTDWIRCTHMIEKKMPA